MDLQASIAELANGFSACGDLMTALGDETRQHLILEMMQMGQCNGVRVGDITRQVNLSRPAVSHHLQILKKAGVVRVRREGTRRYYYFDPDFDRLIAALQLAMEISRRLPGRCAQEEDQE